MKAKYLSSSSVPYTKHALNLAPYCNSKERCIIDYYLCSYIATIIQGALYTTF